MSLSDNFFDTKQSACRSYPTDWWYPVKGREGAKVVRKAIMICRQCPVRWKCLDYALANETHGIWGGMREGEREIERRRRGIKLTQQAYSSMSQQTARTSRQINKVEKDGGTIA